MTTLPNIAQKSKRIEYLDALRGFTMILVVLTHVANFDFGVNVIQDGNFHFYLKQFRMPLFFFVSGFLFYKNNFVWNLTNIKTFLSKKTVVQIITPLIFLVCYARYKDYGIPECITHPSKLGYWFTFALFNYFLMYIALKVILDLKKIKEKYIFILFLLIGGFLYIFSTHRLLMKVGIPELVLNVCSIAYISYFIFFIFGICVKKYFKQFEAILENPFIVTTVLGVYFVGNLFFDTNYNYFILRILNLVFSICGIFMTFAFFKKYESFFADDNKVANTLKFIGKRTLDIYLIHYFFLSFNLPQIFPFFAEHNLPLIEFVVSFLMTIVVISASLFISSILRINNSVAHFLFGEKKHK